MENAMSTNVAFFAWNRSIPGREQLSAEHFKEFLGYLAGEQQSGRIQSFEPVILDSHGGDLGGFVLIRADTAKLDALMSSPAFVRHRTRALLHLEGSGCVRGAGGDLVQERMKLWTELLPR
jgi:hypothetical protein